MLENLTVSCTQQCVKFSACDRLSSGLQNLKKRRAPYSLYMEASFQLTLLNLDLTDCRRYAVSLRSQPSANLKLLALRLDRLKALAPRFALRVPPAAAGSTCFRPETQPPAGFPKVFTALAPTCS